MDDIWTRVADSTAVPEGEMLAIDVEGKRLALYRVGGDVYCTSNICTHGEARLTEGWLEGDVIECPLHGGCFNICTGAGQGSPIRVDLATYPAREEDGAILISLQEHAT